MSTSQSPSVPSDRTHRRQSLRGALYFVAAAAVALVGCAAPSGPRVSGVYAEGTRELLRLDYDEDGDGRIDVRTYMRAARPARLEADRDGDGLIERWEYYDRSGALMRIGTSTARDGREDMWIRTEGARRVVEISTRRDGRVDRRETYERDTLVHAESDTDFDGRTDRWEEFRQGALGRLMLDDERHGRPTRQIVYGPGGAARVEPVGQELDAAR